MCCLINFYAFTFKTPGEVVSSLLTIIILLIAVLFPIVISLVIYVNFKKLKHPNVSGVCGAAYDSMKLTRLNDPNLPDI